MREHTYYVYILTNTTYTVLYTGMSNNIELRLVQHRGGTPGSFTARYRVHRLVYLEATDDVYAAIAREKQIKGWSRAKKIALIESMNPDWRELDTDWPHV